MRLVCGDPVFSSAARRAAARRAPARSATRRSATARSRSSASTTATCSEILNPAAAQGEDSVTITRATAARYQLTSIQGETK
jgi:hypothetical protein